MEPTTAVAADPASTRDRILRVAMDLFIEQGYDATSLREIAEPLGFTKAALYYHFRSKQDILRALMEPAIGLQQSLIGRIDAARTMEDWAALLDWMTDEMFGNYQVFKVADRNRSAVEQLAESSQFFEDHIQLHAQVEAAATRPELSLNERTRIVCALGSVAGFDDFGGKLLDDEPPEQLRAELMTVVRSILGLPPDPPAAS